MIVNRSLDILIVMQCIWVDSFDIQEFDIGVSCEFDLYICKRYYGAIVHLINSNL